MKTIKLTDEQYKTLEGLLEREWEQEWLYQVDGNKDTSLLKDYLSLYEAVLGKPKNFIEALVKKDLITDKLNELGECKQ